MQVCEVHLIQIGGRLLLEVKLQVVLPKQPTPYFLSMALITADGQSVFYDRALHHLPIFIQPIYSIALNNPGWVTQVGFSC